jgi:hypothetical protein
MSRLGINTGNNPNDGQGDPLRVAMGKINSNFLEIYNTIGDGFNLDSYINTSGISTLARNLTGSPRIDVSGILNSGITTTEHLEVRNITSTGVVTATQFVGDGSQLTNVTALISGLEVLDDNVRKGVARELNFGANIVSTGPDGVGRVTISVSTITTSPSSDYASVSGISSYSNVSGIATNAQGLIGTPNLNVGIVTATFFYGDGSNLTNIPSGGGGSGDYATIAGYSTSSGISTLSQGLTGTPNISVNEVGVGSHLSVSGVTTFYDNVNIEDGKALLIGENNDLQLFHSGVDSYIDNLSAGNLIIRDAGIGIQLRRSGGGPSAGLMAAFNNNAGVELYYDSVLKFQTFQNGVAINDSVGIGSTAGNPPYRLTVSGIGATITQGLLNAIADLTSSVDGYGQVNIRNSLSAPNASGDLVITADIGDDASNYINFGINNSGFGTSSWTINGPLDGYLYSSDSNLSIGVAETNKYFSIFAGGTLIENEKVRVTETGVGIGTTNPTSDFHVQGDLFASGVITTTDALFTGIVTATRFESISTESPTIGAATTINLETITVAISTDVTIGRNLNVSGVVTSTGGFISVGNTTPIQISLVGNKLTFTAVGIGSTTLTLF